MTSGWPTWLQPALAILGMAVVTVVTRGFFLVTAAEPRIPETLRRALQVAPLAALVAIVAPDVLLADGALVATWKSARLLGAAAATAWYAWRPGVLGPLVAGLAVYLPLHVGRGW